jgi:hypothetical protein
MSLHSLENILSFYCLFFISEHNNTDLVSIIQYCYMFRLSISANISYEYRFTKRVKGMRLLLTNSGYKVIVNL